MQADDPRALCQDEDADSGANCTSPRPPLDMPLSRTTYIDAEYTDEHANPRVLNGVKMGEGDGTVSLLSLGAMCVEGWKRERWNPAGIKVTTVEVRRRRFVTCSGVFVEVLTCINGSSGTTLSRRSHAEEARRATTSISSARRV